MAARVTGIGIGPASVSWEYVQSNKELARRVVVYLQDRDLLVDEVNREDPEFTRLSAEACREFLTGEIMNVKGGGHLEVAFKTMRDAFRQFGRSAGKNSIHFIDSSTHWAACLTSLRDVIGHELLLLHQVYDVDLGRLQAIVPRS